MSARPGHQSVSRVDENHRQIRGAAVNMARVRRSEARRYRAAMHSRLRVENPRRGSHVPGPARCRLTIRRAP